MGDMRDLKWLLRSWVIFGHLPLDSMRASYCALAYVVMLCLAISHAGTKRLQFTRYAGYVRLCGRLNSMYLEVSQRAPGFEYILLLLLLQMLPILMFCVDSAF